MGKKKNVIILGAAGRDFHDFNMVFRGNPDYRVVCFTAEQIPDIAGRKYPSVLAGRGYPKGIPIYPEEKLSQLIKKFGVDICVFSYSDVPYKYLMNRAALVQASGAEFWLLPPKQTMLDSSKPVISVCAVRTGCGKSQVSRAIVEIMAKKGVRVVAIRHPMPYGDLAKQAVQRFAEYSDLKKHKCTIEEMEEYEPYVEAGMVIYAGVDYEKILRKAEKEADIILWDGGNNDTSFIRSDLHMVIADPLRSGNESSYYPGEVNALIADVLIINKVDSAKKSVVDETEKNLRKMNPGAKILKFRSKVWVDGRVPIKNKRVLCVEDGPTVTHGGMDTGAGLTYATRAKARIVNGRKFASGEIKRTLQKYAHLNKVVPAMGYSAKQIKDLTTTINKANVDYVLAGTPIDLARLLKKVRKPVLRVRYGVDEKGKRVLANLLKPFY